MKQFTYVRVCKKVKKFRQPRTKYIWNYHKFVILLNILQSFASPTPPHTLPHINVDNLEQRSTLQAYINIEVGGRGNFVKKMYFPNIFVRGCPKFKKFFFEIVPSVMLGKNIYHDISPTFNTCTTFME